MKPPPPIPHEPELVTPSTSEVATAASTAFPQPQPGKADSPGPMKVPAEQLRTILGITDVSYVRGQHALAVVDSTLG